MQPILIKTDNSLKQVYSLVLELEDNPETVEISQALTLNKEKPLLGLKGRLGLFGSDKWWKNIRKGKIKTQIVSGVIERTYFAGQDSRWGDQVNSFELRLEDGSTKHEGIYANNRTDKKLFVPDAKVIIAYAFDELKNQPDPGGNMNYAEMPIEVFIST